MALALLAAGCDSQRSAFTREQYRAAATALFERQLYREAIDTYQEYLRSPAIPAEDVPNVLYQMGVIYQENLMDPKGALAKFAVIKALYPDKTFENQLGKRMVACLENMGRSVDATQARSRLTDFNQDTAKAAGAGTVVAELDGRKITLGEIAALVGKLPEAPLELNQLVREYVAQILIADAARRKGIADRPEVKQRIGQAENQILTQAGLLEEIKIQPPSGNDIKYYFEANKARYLQGADSNATFEKLAPRVQADWAREKQGAEYQKYVERLLQTAKVQFFSAPIAGTGAAAAR
ncbi:MAG: Foldase protein PrsA precursor [Fibrobacteres bacterium]|nr:Foldase protein PrsA precursor [Fibrobacterota bacterium]